MECVEGGNVDMELNKTKRGRRAMSCVCGAFSCSLTAAEAEIKTGKCTVTVPEDDSP